MSIEIEIPYPVSLNRAYRGVVVAGKPRTLLSRHGRAYKQQVEMIAASEYDGEPMSGRLAVHLQVWHPDKRRRDLDNLWKLPLDAITGSLIDDDSSITDKRVSLEGYEKGGRAILRIAHDTR